VLHCCWISKN